MHRAIVLVITMLSLAPLSGQAAGMGYDDARHLLMRSGFAPSQAEVQSYAALSRSQAVDRLLAATRPRAQTPVPSWVNEPFVSLSTLKNLTQEERKALQRQQIERGIELRSWWYEEMLNTPAPLGERMTLFWHNHFVSSQQKVKSAQLMYRQNELLRQHALGNFGTLLRAVAKDPAMLIYLDNATSRRGQPNENFARELMELFTLGMGHYGEQDVKEAARAFTGWSLDRDTGEFRFYKVLHDPGTKTVLGRSGDFDGEAVLDILLAHPQTAEFVTAKLWREFVSPKPDTLQVRKFAKIFRDSEYEIKPLLRALFNSDAFFAKENRGVLVKSPVEMLVGTVRQFGIDGMDPRLLVFSGRLLEQDLFGPPNVKGWPGGEAWINSTTLLGRKQVLDRLFRAEERVAVGEPRMLRAVEFGKRDSRPQAAQALMNVRFDAQRFFDAFPGGPERQRASIARLLFGDSPTQMPSTAGHVDFIRKLVLDPMYQLK